MSRNAFERRARESWEKLDSLLRDLQSRRRRRRPEGLSELPGLFRRLCQDLALARYRHYGSKTVDRLNGMALRAHKQMYGVSHRTLARFQRFLAVEFPQAVRAEAGPVLLGLALLFVPFLVTALLIQSWPDLAYSVLSGEQLAQFEQMYPAGQDHPGRDERFGDSDLMMFGMYIWNNIGIAFLTFGAGMSFGVGTILVLLFNGFVMGAVFGHVIQVGGGTALNSFAISHGSFELVAIGLAGGAGLRLGLALVSPGRQSRRAALREAGRRAFPIIGGAGVMLFIAAFIEAYWSPRQSVSPDTKYVVGGLLWLLVVTYLLFAGRGARHVTVAPGGQHGS